MSVSSEQQGRLGRRLSRILLLLPYVIRHPGVGIDELSKKFGVAKRDLVDDLNLVFMCGLPGYGPGDLIDVTIEEDRVYVRMADYFSAPLKLTPAEALSLYAAGTTIADLSGGSEADALRRGLGKLARALGSPQVGSDATGVDIEPAAAPHSHLDALRGALGRRRRARIDYFSASRGELTTRVVEPWGLYTALGRWYLIALDHASGEERMFRVDRVRKVEVLADPVTIPDDFDVERYERPYVERGTESVLRMEISPAAARWFFEYYPTRSAEPVPDGWTRVEVSYGAERWAATLLLLLGTDARSPEPESVVDAARRRATEIAARHSADEES